MQIFFHIYQTYSLLLKIEIFNASLDFGLLNQKSILCILVPRFFGTLFIYAKYMFRHFFIYLSISHKRIVYIHLFISIKNKFPPKVINEFKKLIY